MDCKALIALVCLCLSERVRPIGHDAALPERHLDATVLLPARLMSQMRGEAMPHLVFGSLLPEAVQPPVAGVARLPGNPVPVQALGHVLVSRWRFVWPDRLSGDSPAVRDRGQGG